MKKENTEMSVGKQITWTMTVLGVLWIAAGVTQMFRNLVMQVIHLVLLLSTILIFVIVTRANREDDDEMSKYNYMRAKAKTRDLMTYVFCGATVVCLLVFGVLQDRDVSVARFVVGLLFILMGVQDVFTGVIFRRLEAE